MSHSPTGARQTVPAATTSQRPSAELPVARLHARQSAAPLPQADSQHTPSTQKPLWHSLAAAQLSPSVATRRKMWRMSSEPAAKTSPPDRSSARAGSGAVDEAVDRPPALASPPEPATKNSTPALVATASLVATRPMGPVGAGAGRERAVGDEAAARVEAVEGDVAARAWSGHGQPLAEHGEADRVGAVQGLAVDGAAARGAALEDLDAGARTDRDEGAAERQRRAVAAPGRRSLREEDLARGVVAGRVLFEDDDPTRVGEAARREPGGAGDDRALVGRERAAQRDRSGADGRALGQLEGGHGAEATPSPSRSATSTGAAAVRGAGGGMPRGWRR
ncbi:MAG: hypothetical protein U1F43_32550 [Myxococcota bacterium]